MKRTIVIATLALLAIAIPAAQVAAAPPPEATGPKLGVICISSTGVCPTRYIAQDRAFHVFHKWICNATPLNPDQNGNPAPGIGTNGCMASDFRLWIDGARTGDITIREYYTPPSGKKVLASKGNLTNFPSGLPAGTYQFYWEFWKSGVMTLSGTTPVVATNCQATVLACDPPA